MQSDRRLTELESNLTGMQRALAWLKRQQETGGFIQLVRRGLQPVGYVERIRLGQHSEPIDRFVMKDEDSAFVFECIGICNSRALELASYRREVAVRWLYLRHLLHGTDIPEENELECLLSILRDFALEGLAGEAAIQAICVHHLGGHKVLFSDAEKGLAIRNAIARRLCDVFNEIAVTYGAEPMAASELDEAVAVEAPKVEEDLVALTLAQVDLKVRNGVNMGRWLMPILERDE